MGSWRRKLWSEIKILIRAGAFRFTGALPLAPFCGAYVLRCVNACVGGFSFFLLVIIFCAPKCISIVPALPNEFCIHICFSCVAVCDVSIVTNPRTISFALNFDDAVKFLVACEGFQSFGRHHVAVTLWFPIRLAFLARFRGVDAIQPQLKVSLP